MRKFFLRLGSTILLAGILLAAVWYSRGAPAILTFSAGTLIALGGVLEYFKLLEAKGMKVFRIYGIAAALILLSAIFFDSYFNGESDGLEYAAAILLIMGLFVLQAFERESSGAIGNIAGVLSGVIYVAWLWSFIFKIVYFPGVDGRWLVFAIALIVKGGDMLAYVVGITIGRHKLIPRISPKKTWEGAAGNLAGGLIAGVIVWRWFPCGFSLYAALGMGALLSVIGQIGDMAESMLKRDAGVKDASGSIPGIGGILDVMDSLLLTLPVMYIYLVFRS